MPSFLRFFLPSFHPFIHSFIHSLIRSFVHSFIHSFIHSLIRSFMHHSFIHSFIRSFILSSMHMSTDAYTHACTPLLRPSRVLCSDASRFLACDLSLHLSTHSFVQSCTIQFFIHLSLDSINYSVLQLPVTRLNQLFTSSVTCHLIHSLNTCLPLGLGA